MQIKVNPQPRAVGALRLQGIHRGLTLHPIVARQSRVLSKAQRMVSCRFLPCAAQCAHFSRRLVSGQGPWQRRKISDPRQRPRLGAPPLPHCFDFALTSFGTLNRLWSMRVVSLQVFRTLDKIARLPPRPCGQGHGVNSQRYGNTTSMWPKSLNVPISISFYPSLSATELEAPPLWLSRAPRCICASASVVSTPSCPVIPFQ